MSAVFLLLLLLVQVLHRFRPPFLLHQAHLLPLRHPPLPRSAQAHPLHKAQVPLFLLVPHHLHLPVLVHQRAFRPVHLPLPLPRHPFLLPHHQVQVPHNHHPPRSPHLLAFHLRLLHQLVLQLHHLPLPVNLLRHHSRHQPRFHLVLARPQAPA